MDIFEKMALKSNLVAPEDALPGRESALTISGKHYVLGSPMKPPFNAPLQSIVLGMGCFWGAEKKFWTLPEIASTAVGYCGGFTKNPNYEEVCSGKTGHTEVVLVVFDPGKISVNLILKVFWESHDPTQGMRQGNDVGTQYRSAVFYNDPSHLVCIEQSRDRCQNALSERGLGPITTEIADTGEFYFAEEYHQQYLAKNPNGYCGMGGTGIKI